MLEMRGLYWDCYHLRATREDAPFADFFSQIRDTVDVQHKAHNSTDREVYDALHSHQNVVALVQFFHKTNGTHAVQVDQHVQE